MMRTSILAVAAASLAAMPAFGQETKVYTEAAYQFIAGDGDDFHNVGARLGAVFGDIAGIDYGLEGEFFIGAGGGDFSSYDFGFAAYGTGSWDFTSRIDLFGRVGYGYSQFSLAGVEFDFDDDGLSVGGGARFDLSRKWALRSGYTYQDIAGDAHVIDAALVYRFGE